MVTSCLYTSHQFARELLRKPDGFITASLGDREFIIEDYKRAKGHANVDDSVPYWTLNLRECGQNNIKR